MLFRRSFNLAYQVGIMTRLAFLLSAGIPFIQAFALVVEKEKVVWKKAHLQKIFSSITQGKTITKSLELKPLLVGGSVLRIIKNAEISGTLSKSFVLITQDLSARIENRRQVVGALLYPVVVVCFSILLAVFLYLFVFPQILPIITASGAELPLVTRVLVWSFQVTESHGLLMASSTFGLVGIFVGVFTYIRKLRHLLSTLVAHALGTSYFFRLYKVGDFCRTLAMFLETGHTLVESLVHISEDEQNLYFKNVLVKLADDVRRGKRFSSVLNSKIFSLEMIQFVLIGEETGGLSASLRHVSVLYENDMKSLQKKLFALVEPLLMIVLGLFVAFIALALVVPMYNLTSI